MAQSKKNRSKLSEMNEQARMEIKKLHVGMEEHGRKLVQEAQNLVELELELEISILRAGSSQDVQRTVGRRQEVATKGFQHFCFFFFFLILHFPQMAVQVMATEANSTRSEKERRPERGRQVAAGGNTSTTKARSRSPRGDLCELEVLYSGESQKHRNSQGKDP